MSAWLSIVRHARTAPAPGGVSVITRGDYLKEHACYPTHPLATGANVAAVTSFPCADPAVLHLLIDTSTWLDLAKRRDGQRLIRPLQTFVETRQVELLVPQVIVDEFDRRRADAEKTVTTSLTERFKNIRQELVAYADMDYRGEQLKLFDQWAYQVSLSGALTTRNFDDIRLLLEAGRRLEPTAAEDKRVVARGLAKKAPLHRDKNSVADALLAEMYATSVASAGPSDTYAFITSNYQDFYVAHGDRRQPHDDLADMFAPEHSTYWYDVEGLEQCLRDEFDDYLEELMAGMFFLPTKQMAALYRVFIAGMGKSANKRSAARESVGHGDCTLGGLRRLIGRKWLWRSGMHASPKFPLVGQAEFSFVFVSGCFVPRRG